jgi:hypothetical protein
MSPTLGEQLVWLGVLALPVACVSWTVTHEDVFREPRNYCSRRSRECRRLASRKFFYIFTCEYCFSHYVALAFLLATGYRLLIDDWRGSVIAYFALVAVANVYMSAYNRLRVDIRAEKAEVETLERACREPEEGGRGGESQQAA